MSSVRQARPSIKHRDASQWPAWTDEMTFEPSDPAHWPGWTDCIVVVPTPELPEGPDPDEDADHDFAPAPEPTEPPDLATVLPAADWLDMQAAHHRCEHEHGPDPLGCHLLCAGALAQLARGLRGQHARGILASAPARVEVPARHAFGSPLSVELAGQAALLYPYDSAVTRLAARAFVYLARDCEGLGSTTAENYLVDEAAARSAAIDAMCEGMAF